MDPSPSPRQLGLIGIAGPTARRDDPDTSFAAGRLVDVLNPSSTAYRILAELRAAGAEGRTDGESSAAMPDLWAPSVVKRRGDLVGWGLVVDSGRRRPSPRSGRKMVADDYCTCAATRRNQHEPSCPWLSPNERLVALAHCFYATWADGGDCRPGAAKIAKRTGLSARSIHEIRASLVRKGWMVLEHRGGAPMGSRREANVYALVVPDVDTQGTSFTGEVPSLVKRTPSTSEAGAPTSEAGAPTSEAGGTPPPLTSSDLLKNPPPASWRSPSGMDDQDTRTTDDPQEPLDPFEEDVAHARAAAASWYLPDAILDGPSSDPAP